MEQAKTIPDLVVVRHQEGKPPGPDAGLVTTGLIVPCPLQPFHEINFIEHTVKSRTF